MRIKLILFFIIIFGLMVFPVLVFLPAFAKASAGELAQTVIETPEFTFQEVTEFQRRGLRLNPLLPIEDIRLVLAIMMHTPVRFGKAALKHLIGQRFPG